MEASPDPTSKLYFELAAESPPHLKEALNEGFSFISSSALHNLTFERITAGGSSSQLYRFSTGNENFVLRIIDPKGCFNPSNGFGKRKNEIHAHQTASKVGVAPKLIYSDPKFLITIMQYAPGHSLCEGDLQDKTRLEQLAGLLKKLHATPHSLLLRKAQLNRAKDYYNQAKSKGIAFPSCFAELFEKFVQEAQELRPTDLTLNHGDLHPGNILLTDDHCLFIDWAYASADYHLSDVAYLTILSGMNRFQILSFYNSYLGRVSSDHDLELLERAQAHTCLMLATALFNLSETEEDLKQPMKERIDRINLLLESPELKNFQYYIKGTNCIHPRKSLSSDVQLCALAFLKECIKREGALCT